MVHEIKLDFKVDLSNERKQIRGASSLELMLEINSDHMYTAEGHKNVGVVQSLIDKYPDMTITV